GATGRCCAACCPGAAPPAHRRRRISCLAWPHGCALASRRTSCRTAAGTAKICNQFSNNLNRRNRFMKNTERLLLEIGLRPSRRGFAQSAMLLCILRDRPEITSSSAAYTLAAERLCATPGQLEHNLRVAIHEAWERGDRALLRR